MCAVGTMVWPCAEREAQDIGIEQCEPTADCEKSSWARCDPQSRPETFGSQTPAGSQDCLARRLRQKLQAHKLSGMVHDAVVHCKKHVKVKGKYQWLKPKYTHVVKHKLPDGRQLSVNAGTQHIDCAWRYLKDRLPLNHSMLSLPSPCAPRSEVLNTSIGTVVTICGLQRASL